ncbi:MAG TPA: DNA cytosine methyltransferase [Pyrinomonadaceae bacterium]|jgi:DNA (cytosine-5)-methyltransferase 1
MTATAKINKTKTIIAADMWCGGGGTSTGLVEAVSKLGYNLELTAVNHWDIAVATHSANHPKARHFCKAVDSINPLEIYAGRWLQLLVASPECVHHSRARGGKPRDEQKRADAWDLKRWIEKLYIENLIIENVREFVDWGPLGADGKPLKSKKGVYFKQFIDYLEILYKVEWRILNCADYGDATTRERFFLIAKRGKNKKIVFPEPTHASRKVLARKQPGLFATKELKPWRAAREIIDWSLEGKSIFGRKKPLSENTMKRIFAGLFKYSLKPFVMGTGGPTGQQRPRSVEEPLRTVLTDGRQNLFVPYLINLKATDRRDRSIEEPTFTQCGANHQYLVEPFLVNLSHTKTTMQRCAKVWIIRCRQFAAKVCSDFSSLISCSISAERRQNLLTNRFRLSPQITSITDWRSLI